MSINNEALPVVNIVIERGESPVLFRGIGIEEIDKGVGATRDLAQVLQIFPWVTETVLFRNDLIVMGGEPFENKFFLTEFNCLF